MKPLIILSCIVLAFLFGCFFFTATADFTDDFEKGLKPLWNPVNGIWKVEDGLYHGTAIGTLPCYSLLPFMVTDGSVIQVSRMCTERGTYKMGYISNWSQGIE